MFGLAGKTDPKLILEDILADLFAIKRKGENISHIALRTAQTP